MAQALLVFAVGMITVFLILGLVVLSGQILIRVVNAFSTEEVQTVPEPRNVGSISEQELAVIVAAVDLFTQGKGKVEHIEKL